VEPITWKLAAWIGVGGALGALSRAWAVSWVSRQCGASWPLGTLGVNLTGSFALGVLAGLVASRGWLGPQAVALCMTGFLGAFTTFSTFSVEALKLWRASSSPWPAVGYVLASVLGGLALAALGWALGHLGRA
jgi:CrcB protein